MSHDRGWHTKRLRRDCARRGRWLWRLVSHFPGGVREMVVLLACLNRGVGLSPAALFRGVGVVWH